MLKNNDDYENNESSFRIIVELAALEGFSSQSFKESQYPLLKAFWIPFLTS